MKTIQPLIEVNLENKFEKIKSHIKKIIILHLFLIIDSRITQKACGYSSTAPEVCGEDSIAQEAGGGDCIAQKAQERSR